MRKIAKGQEARAFKALCSNGVANATDAVIAELKQMHPARAEELKLPQVKAQQLTLDADLIFGHFYNNATDFELAKDVWMVALTSSFKSRGEGRLP